MSGRIETDPFNGMRSARYSASGIPKALISLAFCTTSFGVVAPIATSSGSHCSVPEVLAAAINSGNPDILSAFLRKHADPRKETGSQRGKGGDSRHWEVAEPCNLDHKMQGGCPVRRPVQHFRHDYSPAPFSNPGEMWLSIGC